MILDTPLRCELSGLLVGKLETIVTAGVLPYISYWDKMQKRHPVFAMNNGKLLNFARDEWQRLAKLAVDEDISTKESEILCVTFLAVLHSLDCIKQDQPSLPPLAIVQSNFNKLMALATWKHYLESQRFRFPTYHISRSNGNLDFGDLHHYFDTCFAIKDDYSTKITELQEKEQARAAQAVIDRLTKEWITPVSRKVLWTWVASHLPSKYAGDAWLKTIFLGGSTVIIEFEEEDIELFDEIIQSSIPSEAAIGFAVRERIAKVWELWKLHHRAFEIDLADFAVNAGVLVNGAPVNVPDPGPEPIQSGYLTRSSFVIAKAKWTIAYSAWTKQNRKSDDPSVNDQLGEI